MKSEAESDTITARRQFIRCQGARLACPNALMFAQKADLTTTAFYRLRVAVPSFNSIRQLTEKNT